MTIKTKCCYCGKEILVSIPTEDYKNNPNLGKSCSCNNCIPENSAARDGINESIYTERLILGLGYELANKGIICIVKNNNDVIEEFVDKVFLIFKINGTPIDKTLFGDIYRVDSVDSISIDLYTKNTMEMLLTKGLISHHYIPSVENTQNWLLSHLIQYKKDLPTDMLDYILSDNSNYDVEGWLTLVENCKIGEWLLSKGSSLDKIPGYGSPKEWWEIKQRTDLIEHFYN